MNGIETWLNAPVTEAIERRRLPGPRIRTAIDVGANVGSWTVALSDIFDEVIAVEPDARNVEKLSNLVATAPNARVLQAAVSDTTGTASFYLRVSSGHGSLSDVHPIGGDGMSPVPVIGRVEVRCLTLDEICDGLGRDCDLVKIDIEGGEVLALKGCRNEEHWWSTVFVVECHDTFAEVAVELERLGKRVTRIPHPLVAHPGHCWAIGE